VSDQQATPLAYESATCSRSPPSSRSSRAGGHLDDADPQLEPFVARGRELFMQRQGNSISADTNCHDDNWESGLRGLPSRKDTTGYPLYRLEWQSLGSLQRRRALYQRHTRPDL